LVEPEPCLRGGVLGRLQADLRTIDRGGDEVDEQLVVAEPASGVPQGGGATDAVEDVQPARLRSGAEQMVGLDLLDGAIGTGPRNSASWARTRPLRSPTMGW
jgi:hypothetical protein